MTAARKRFAVATGTAPSAEETSDVPASRRPDVKTAGPSQPSRTAFTWRLTAEQAFAMDDMTLRLKRELGRAKLDRAEILTALMQLAAGNPAVFGALVAQLQQKQTP